MNTSDSDLTKDSKLVMGSYLQNLINTKSKDCFGIDSIDVVNTIMEIEMSKAAEYEVQTSRLLNDVERMNSFEKRIMTDKEKLIGEIDLKDNEIKNLNVQLAESQKLLSLNHNQISQMSSFNAELTSRINNQEQNIISMAMQISSYKILVDSMEEEGKEIERRYLESKLTIETLQTSLNVKEETQKELESIFKDEIANAEQKIKLIELSLSEEKEKFENQRRLSLDKQHLLQKEFTRMEIEIDELNDSISEMRKNLRDKDLEILAYKEIISLSNFQQNKEKIDKVNRYLSTISDSESASLNDELIIKLENLLEKVAPIKQSKGFANLVVSSANSEMKGSIISAQEALHLLNGIKEKFCQLNFILLEKEKYVGSLDKLELLNEINLKLKSDASNLEAQLEQLKINSSQIKDEKTEINSKLEFALAEIEKLGILLDELRQSNKQLIFANSFGTCNTCSIQYREKNQLLPLQEQKYRNYTPNFVTRQCFWITSNDSVNDYKKYFFDSLESLESKYFELLSDRLGKDIHHKLNSNNQLDRTEESFNEVIENYNEYIRELEESNSYLKTKLEEELGKDKLLNSDIGRDVSSTLNTTFEIKNESAYSENRQSERLSSELMSKEVELLNKKVFDLLAEIKSLRAETANLKSSSKTYEYLLAESKRKIEEANGRVAAESNQVSKYKAELELISQQSIKINHLFIDMQSKNAESVKKLEEELRKEYSTYMISNRELKLQYDEVSIKIISLNDKLSSLAQLITSVDVINENPKNSLEDIRKENILLNKQLFALKTEIEFINMKADNSGILSSNIKRPPAEDDLSSSSKCIEEPLLGKKRKLIIEDPGASPKQSPFNEVLNSQLKELDSENSILKLRIAEKDSEIQNLLMSIQDGVSDDLRSKCLMKSFISRVNELHDEIVNKSNAAEHQIKLLKGKEDELKDMKEKYNSRLESTSKSDLSLENFKILMVRKQKEIDSLKSEIETLHKSILSKEASATAIASINAGLISTSELEELQKKLKDTDEDHKKTVKNFFLQMLKTKKIFDFYFEKENELNGKASEFKKLYEDLQSKYNSQAIKIDELTKVNSSVNSKNDKLILDLKEVNALIKQKEENPEGPEKDNTKAMFTKFRKTLLQSTEIIQAQQKVISNFTNSNGATVSHLKADLEKKDSLLKQKSKGLTDLEQKSTMLKSEISSLQLVIESLKSQMEKGANKTDQITK